MAIEPLALPVPTPVEPGGRVGGPAFAHKSEAELARILDFYAVRWDYEPHVYPILWNPDGSVVESFAPDFYLPDFDSYLELTTLRQPLVRKKNRKLRRLRELYPDIRIKLFYARDFRALMLKYGKFGLVDALSGTSGQVLPPGAAGNDDDDSPEPVAAVASPERATPTLESEPALVRVESAGTASTSASASARRRRRRRTALAQPAAVEL